MEQIHAKLIDKGAFIPVEYEEMEVQYLHFKIRNRVIILRNYDHIPVELGNTYRIELFTACNGDRYFEKYKSKRTQKISYMAFTNDKDNNKAYTIEEIIGTVEEIRMGKYWHTIIVASELPITLLTLWDEPRMVDQVHVGDYIRASHFRMRCKVLLNESDRFMANDYGYH